MNKNSWLLLILSLPANPATARMRIWRSLKSLGCAALRDGTYLLPDSTAAHEALHKVAEEIIQAGGAAYLLLSQAVDNSQQGMIQALFDRSTSYEALIASITAFERDLPGQESAQAKRALVRLQREFEQIREIDFFPGFHQQQAEAALGVAKAKLMAKNSPGEPSSAQRTVEKLSRADYQKRVWATRRHMWADRVASAWLIRRFIDAEPSFIWLDNPKECPAEALGFDFDDAAFTHVGKLVTFEVLLTSFGLDTDASLSRIGRLIHFLDVGGMPVAEAAGLEMLLRGARQQSKDDDELLENAGRAFDYLYAAFKNEQSMAQNTQPKSEVVPIRKQKES